MRLLRYLILFIPFVTISQQTLEICGDTKSINYFTTSNVASTVEWYCAGQYYYGNSITITWDTPGTYEITATAIANECLSVPQIYTVVITECDPLVYWVPNTFTPNGDEFNTTWGPVFNGPYDIMDFHLIVFNRWGSLIWESRDATERWNGTYANRYVTDGVYIWVIDFGMPDTDARKILHGHVTIIR